MRRPRFEQNRQFYLEVGARIAKARRGNLTQKELAARTLLTRTSIINIEKGRQQVLLHTMVDIAKALNVSVSDLIPGMDDIDILLRNKAQKGRAWVKASTTNP
jgi:transcriptional regulator with XRE-family HTH domain